MSDAMEKPNPAVAPALPTKVSPKPIAMTDGLSIDMPKEFEDTAIANDPEYAAMLKAEKDAAVVSPKSKPAAKPKKEEPPAEEPPMEVPAEEPPAGEEPPASEGAEVPKEESEESTPAEDQIPAEFADNVIEGITGKAFSELPEDVQVSLGTLVEKHEAATAKVTEAEARLTKLLADPIIRHRNDLIEKGRPELAYEIPKMTSEELSQVKTALDLDDDELTKLEPLLNQIAEKKTRAMAYNSALEQDITAKMKEETTKGRAAILGLSKFNKALDAGLTAEDVDGILNLTLDQRSKHPKYDKWQSGPGKVYDCLTSKGFQYKDIIKLKPESLYGLVAAELGLPVAPTPEVLKKITASAKEKALARFYKPGKKDEARGLASDQGGPDRRTLDKGDLKDGIDRTKLASDTNYYETQLNKHPGDPAWISKIDALEEEGADILRKRKKR